jgi:predicted TIM-barrel fold metal-dependent hydrolase
MFRSRHLHVAEILRHFPDTRVVRGHDDFRKRFCFFALLNDALDERLACDERERLAGKPRRSKACGNYAYDFHATNLATDETWMKY